MGRVGHQLEWQLDRGWKDLLGCDEWASYLVPTDHRIVGPEQIDALRRTLRFVGTVMTTMDTFEHPELKEKLKIAQADWDSLGALIGDDR